MLYSICIVLILVASIILILAILVQNPKSGMAANFGAANQTMGVRQTTDFLEKFTWAMIAAIVFFTLLSVIALPKSNSAAAIIGTEEIAAGVDEATKVVDETITEGEEDIVLEADANGAVVVEQTTENTEE